jgi:hypothetical protein
MYYGGLYRKKCESHPSTRKQLSESIMNMSPSPAAALQGPGSRVPALRRPGSESSIQHNGSPSLSLSQKAFAAVILGSLAFVPLYGIGVLFKGYSKMPMIYASLVGFVAAEYAGRHDIFGIADDEQDK